MHGTIAQIIFGYFVLYFLLFITIKHDMKTAQNIFHNLINNTFPFNGQFIKTRWLIFGDSQFMPKHTFHIQNPSIYLFGLATLAHA